MLCVFFVYQLIVWVCDNAAKSYDVQQMKKPTKFILHSSLSEAAVFEENQALMRAPIHTIKSLSWTVIMTRVKTPYYHCQTLASHR